MKKRLVLVVLLAIVSVAGFSAEQTITLRVTGISVGSMGLASYEFEIIDGPGKGESRVLYPTSELYKSVLERYIKPASRIVIRIDLEALKDFDMSSSWKLPLSSIVSIDGKSIETLFR